MTTRRLIGYAVTNSSGVATLNYTGQGLGEMDIVAETGGEMLFHHSGIQGATETDSFQYSTSDMTVTPSSTGTTVVNNADATKSYWANKTGTTTGDGRDFDLPITIEFDYTIYNNTSVSLQLWKSNTSEDYVGVNLKNALDNYNLSSAHIKVVLTTSKITVFVDGNTYQDNNFSFISSGLVAVRFICGANTGFKYKNFFIYTGNTQLTSEPYSLLDCTFYDGGVTGNTNGGFYYTLFSSSEVSHSTDSTGTTVANLTNSLKTLRVKYANSTELQFPDTCRIEFDLLSISGNVSLQIWKSNTSGDYVGIDLDQLVTGLTEAHISIELTGTKLIVKVGSTEKQNTNFSFVSGGNMSIRFLLEDTDSFKYKEFKVYPI